MAATVETALVPFHGQQLLTIKDGDTIRVAMRPICEAIGLDWSAQLQRIKRHPVLSTCVVIITTQVPGSLDLRCRDDNAGQSREVVTLPLDYLNGWLFGIDTSRVKPELQESLIAYQRECFAVLAAYWHQGVATNPRARAGTVRELISTQRESIRLMQALKAETNPIIRLSLHAYLEQLCRLLGQPAPPIEAIGREAPPEPPLVAEFWEAVEHLTGQGEKLNHARDPRLVAINLLEFERAAQSRGLRLPPASAFRRVLRESRNPKFIDVRAVNSALLGRSVKCWIFAPQNEEKPL